MFYIHIKEVVVHPMEITPMADYVATNGLVDLKILGCFYTWNKGGNHTYKVWSKIDRMMVNLEWLATFPVCSALFLAPGISNHCLVLLSWGTGCDTPKPFIFNNKWIMMEGYDNVIADISGQRCRGTLCSSWYRK